MKTKFIYSVLGIMLTISSCSKKEDIAMNPINEVFVTYKVGENNGNGVNLKRKITFLSDWTEKNDIIFPVLTDTIVTGEFEFSLIIRTFKRTWVNHPKSFNYFAPISVGWMSADSTPQLTYKEIYINGGLISRQHYTCKQLGRPSGVSYQNVNDWDWDGK